MKVVLVCHSDTNGGASVVTFRLLHALRRAGVDAKMLVFTKYSSDPDIEVPSSRLRRGITFYAERIGILKELSFDRDNLFKISTASVGIGITKHPFIREADIVCLSWFNQGLVSLKDIKRLGKMGKKIVWTMHDMWAMTGICHHSLGCENYRNLCGNCRFLGMNRSPVDLSYKVHQKKKELYKETPIIYIAVSNWLKERAKESSLLRNKDVRVIPNAFPIETFRTDFNEELRPFGMNAEKRYILMGAARLDDPIKGLDYAIEALNKIFDTNPMIANTCEAIFFGTIRNPEAFKELRFPHRFVGQINDPIILRDLYACGNIVISTSLYETLPGTLIEGQAAGCLPVSFGRGGQADIISHLDNGYIAKYRDTTDFAEGIMWALRRNVDREELHQSVGNRFSSEQVAAKYIALFNELMNNESASE